MMFKAGLAAALLFGTGVATGWAVTRGRATSAAPSMEPPAEATPASATTNPAAALRTKGLRFPQLRPPGASRLEQFKRALGELELDAEQRTRIEAHFRESQERIKALLKPVQPEAQRELRSLRQHVASELTREQRAQFERQLNERNRVRLTEPLR